MTWKGKDSSGYELSKNVKKQGGNRSRLIARGRQRQQYGNDCLVAYLKKTNFWTSFARPHTPASSKSRRL